jgi:hypothetical protein
MKNIDQERGHHMADRSKSSDFLEKLDKDTNVDLNEYRVDDLRKLASKYHIAGSHGLKKPDLVAAINAARDSQTQTGYDLAA